jgi:uncharacterized protein DUF6624
VDLDLVRELGARCGADQALRRLPLDEPGLVDRLAAVDEDNQAWLRRLVEERGWQGRTVVGAGGAQDAWLLAQHAPDLDFQVRCRDLVAAAVDAGEATPAQLAYLDDRVRMRQGRAQRYGTQVRMGADGHPAPFEIEEPDGVDDRRRAVGLGPLAGTSPASSRPTGSRDRLRNQCWSTGFRARRDPSVPPRARPPHAVTGPSANPVTAKTAPSTSHPGPDQSSSSAVSATGPTALASGWPLA